MKLLEEAIKDVLGRLQKRNTDSEIYITSSLKTRVIYS